MEVMEVEKAPSANISPVGSSKRCLAGRPAKNIFQKYPPENFLRPPRCIGGAVSAAPPYTFNRSTSSPAHQLLKSKNRNRKTQLLYLELFSYLQNFVFGHSLPEVITALTVSFTFL